MAGEEKLEASTANAMVAITIQKIKEQRKRILYMMDEFSAYTQAEVISNKEADSVITTFDKIWIQEGPGRPTRGVISSSNEETDDLQMREMVTKKVMIMYYKDSLWNNGKNGRKYYIMNRTIDKLMEEDPKLSLEDAVKHTVNAHNVQINRN